MNCSFSLKVICGSIQQIQRNKSTEFNTFTKWKPRNIFLNVVQIKLEKLYSTITNYVVCKANLDGTPNEWSPSREIYMIELLLNWGLRPHVNTFTFPLDVFKLCIHATLCRPFCLFLKDWNFEYVISQMIYHHRNAVNFLNGIVSKI